MSRLTDSCGRRSVVIGEDLLSREWIRAREDRPRTSDDSTNAQRSLPDKVIVMTVNLEARESMLSVIRYSLQVGLCVMLRVRE